MIKQATQPGQISRLTLEGYKSIETCDIELGRINILIGANGAGKSNFIGFFGFLRKILDRQLQVTVGQAGGPDAILHFGRKTTEKLAATVVFCKSYTGNEVYKFILAPTGDNRLLFLEETQIFPDLFGDSKTGDGHFETIFDATSALGNDYELSFPNLRKWRIFHFHDTSSSARVKLVHGINDNVFLREDANNLAAFLLRICDHHPEHYQRIVKTIRLVAPFFGDFHLRPTVHNPDKIQLEWTEAGQDEPFFASALSDGTLRFICLATLLLQPDEFMPATILIDEPELGLHPYAINVLAGLMKSVSETHQLIVSTQSVELVDCFDAEDLIVVDKRDGASTFKQPDPDELKDWLEDYSLGELWKKNLLGGRPGL
ncbi:AAA family ATPase [Agrobacterium vitis]|uniref:Chromosome segregation protein SMC n=1 Tax=Agrobacterium vitis TaxID=373 RepID=A0A368NXC0_AGRVI|nr:AAA family ATPase [Agrobacterium vitis]KAA3519694.1 chromosome segregation protein SMC [Agrobacterium vitis]KAA3532094.1 chromosome segregation protein SMC [Agrobacterium vitis]MCF1475846.1 AAA family ATPase [Agrobacterium vitis]MUZ97096.1 AAA family ATPase [Agrobacterium vitis]MVA32014.1 AAA family ATPase [Agrobacterium vitis]